MTALGARFRRYGLPIAIQADRARWAPYPRAGPGQARGRSERVDRTLPDRPAAYCLIV